MKGVTLPGLVASPPPPDFDAMFVWIASALRIEKALPTVKVIRPRLAIRYPVSAS